MSSANQDNADSVAKANEPDTIGGVLTAALNAEDDISSGVYEEYLDRRHWPAELDETVFLKIKEYVTVLIEDTKKHKKILEALVREHGSDE